MASLFRTGFAAAGRHAVLFALPGQISAARHFHTVFHGHCASTDPRCRLKSRRSFSSGAGPDPYKTLGVDRNASADDIKKAYRKEALRWHPDKNPPEKRKEAESRFGAIASAYEVLGDAEKKRQFDTGGFSAGPGGFPGSFHGATQDSQGMHGMHSQESAERLFKEVFGSVGAEQLLSQLFGQMPGDPFGGQRGPQTLQVGMDVQVVPDDGLVKRASRASGIDSTNDALRIRCLGKAGTIIKADPRDQSVKVRVEGIGDAWFGAQAVRPQATRAGTGPSAAFRRHGSPFPSAFGAGGGPGMMQMRQEMMRKPDGSTVMRTIRTRRMPDGSMREEVMETPVS